MTKTAPRRARRLAIHGLLMQEQLLTQNEVQLVRTAPPKINTAINLRHGAGLGRI